MVKLCARVKILISQLLCVYDVEGCDSWVGVMARSTSGLEPTTGKTGQPGRDDTLKSRISAVSQ